MPNQARWALSSDDFLQSVGTNTGINYRRDFEEYLEILMKGLRKKKRSILNVFKEWDRVVFPNSDSSSTVSGEHGQNINSHGLNRALNMLEADEDGEEEDELLDQLSE